MERVDRRLPPTDRPAASLKNTKQSRPPRPRKRLDGCGVIFTMSQQWGGRRFTPPARGTAVDNERQRGAPPASSTLRSSPAPRPPFRSTSPIPANNVLRDYDDERFTSDSRGSDLVSSSRQPPSSRHTSVVHSGARFRPQGYPDALVTDSGVALIRSASRTRVLVAPAATRGVSTAARSTRGTPHQGRSGDSYCYFSADSSFAAVDFLAEEALDASSYQGRHSSADHDSQHDRDTRHAEDYAAPMAFASLDSPTESGTRSSPGTTVVAVSLPRVRRLRTQRRREQCRVNQARYRQRQNLRLQVLEELATCRQEEINLLSALHSASLQQFDHISVATRIVYEYASLFHHGLSGAKLSVPVFRATPPASVGDMILFSAGSVKDRQSDSLLRQAAYLRTIFAPDADFDGVLQGPDAILEQWWRYSTFHKHVFFDVLRVESLLDRDNLDGCVHLMVTSRICVVPNRQTLVHIFPHLQQSSLGERLAEQPVEFTMRMGLLFDSTDAGGSLQIVQMNTDVDLIAGLIRILSRLEDVEAVLCGASISPQGIIGSTVNHPSGNRLLDAMAAF